MKNLNPIHRNDAQNQVAATESTTAAVNGVNDTLQDKATSQDIAGVVDAVKNIPPAPTEMKVELTNKTNELATQFFSMLKGDQGVKGDQGEQGERGDVGEAIKGDQGEQGIPGKKGEKGPKGEKGLKGDDGKDGKDGKNGEKGADGSLDTGEQIVEKLNPLKNALDFEVLTNIPDFALSKDVGGYSGRSGPVDVWHTGDGYQFNKLTVSTTQPSSPKVNDLWYDIS